MSDYDFKQIEAKWQQYWADNHTFQIDNHSDKPKYYVLDMFPYPSGAGLHVGHPLGYIATDIVGRFKMLQGYHVLHPMGFDAFGLPAEQYAIQTGQHPAQTTSDNINTYKRQLRSIGFGYDWSREIWTTRPDYYKWTQWIFMQIFDSWYDKKSESARPISQLICIFESHGNIDLQAQSDSDTPTFTAKQWAGFSTQTQQTILLCYRLAYLSETSVNWCPALGMVLANDEVKDGRSERGGHAVERRAMRQWSMRISAYAERLLSGLDGLDWPEAVKEMQRHWIGKSVGAQLNFVLQNHADIVFQVFTTRPDTIFGVTYLAIAPEHPLAISLATEAQKTHVLAYIDQTKKRSERERQADVRQVSGVFSGSYAIHPFSGEPLPIWLADYVLAGYGTGIVMAVPSSDERDFAFATYFNLPIVMVIEGTENSDNPAAQAHGRLINSDFLNGLDTRQAAGVIIENIKSKNIGAAKINYRMRDAAFARQRYWGEPMPVYFDAHQMPHLIKESDLPLVLPQIDEYKPTETGLPPLGRANNWKYNQEFDYELSTMPGWAGSSWYWFRYMDSTNSSAFASPESLAYWQQVDLYVGGSEHATGHLLYSRFWCKILHDLGHVPVQEPFKKMVNQGMIQGRSLLVYRIQDSNTYVSKHLIHNYQTTALHIDINLADAQDILDIEKLRNWRPDFADAEFIYEPNGDYICGYETEKMSKSLHNVVNPDQVTARYGADTLRMYEMFLGPLEQSKPWSMHGIEGVYKFLKKFWRLFHNENGDFVLSEASAEPAELKILHRTIKKIAEDIERLSFNTAVSAFMVAANELTSLKCNKKVILSDLIIVLWPFAPHICEELWQKMGVESSVALASYPSWNADFLVESVFEYPISINGKVRCKLSIAADANAQQIESQALASEQVLKWLDGKTPKKVIVVVGKIVNIVLG